MRTLSTRSGAWRLGAFAVVALAVTLTIAATIRPFGSGTDRRTYRAEFTSASRLVPGDDVRVAGVKVGTVRSVTVTPDAKALVALDVHSDLPVDHATTLEIRYLDLAGHRYVALVPHDGAAVARQRPSDVIGTSRTQPALDLDDLLDGFKPLLVALSPEDVNSLTLDIVRTLQGDGPTVQNLIARTASLTTGLAQRDQLIASVVQNLDTAVGSVSDRHAELEQLVAGLRVFATGLSRDRRSVGEAIDHVDTMTRLSADLLARARPSTRADIARLRRVAETLSSPIGHAEIDHALSHLPDKLARLTATASYGSWFNYYICGVRLTVGLGLARIDPALARTVEKVHLVDTSGRCTS
jgi:phospholipid/cholesterol/gamma-HCH transport system substrate-binding protein